MSKENTAETPATSEADKRKNLRSPLIVQKVRLGEGRKVFFGYSKNISRSGMFIASSNPIEPGTRIDVEIPLPIPARGPVRCRCEVVWKRPYAKSIPFEPGMGLKFLDLPGDIAQALDDWIKEQQ